VERARWYNDSIATAPERSMAAIRAFDEPIVLLLGGRDKDLAVGRLDPVWRMNAWITSSFLARRRIRSRKRWTASGWVRGVLLLSRSNGLHEAVLQAAEVAEAGDVVLLSPGGTSFDEFKDFEERGERFRTWVQELS
jgi:UDP-N-acetylmuramoylalanine--D-glutamate ligase